MRTQRVLASNVRLQSRILCSDGASREVDMIERGRWDNGDAFRFSFTDDRWLEVPLDGYVTCPD